ncbi:hypothetical protein O181_128876 [Austropuccinia psidii MF-1]|uniref:Uncharacterized protein n=1 Tax=Austropuccinia psidii MF-1 TaxID=1389203 RepID=A0A9Q3Q836_9BASI|nr:hypothetical protein [Austropuccinia psidii MF-1]
MKDIITRTRIGKTWTRIPIESKMVSKPSREDKRPERPVLKCHKCESTSNLANTCIKKTKINKARVIEEVQCAEEKEESDLDSAVYESHLLPIEGVQFSSSSINMYPLGILDSNLVFPHPTGSVRMKTEILAMDNCKSQHIILANDYLNIYEIDINNHKDKYFTIGENKRQKFAFFNIPVTGALLSEEGLALTYGGLRIW